MILMNLFDEYLCYLTCYICTVSSTKMCIFCESIHDNKMTSLTSDFGKPIMKSIDAYSHL